MEYSTLALTLQSIFHLGVSPHPLITLRWNIPPSSASHIFHFSYSTFHIPLLIIFHFSYSTSHLGFLYGWGWNIPLHQVTAHKWNIPLIPFFFLVSICFTKYMNTSPTSIWTVMGCFCAKQSMCPYHGLNLRIQNPQL